MVKMWSQFESGTAHGTAQFQHPIAAARVAQLETDLGTAPRKVRHPEAVVTVVKLNVLRHGLV